MTLSFRPCRIAAAFMTFLLLLAVAGCGTEAVKRQQVQDDLHLALQRAEVGQMQEARQWADRAIAVSPQDMNTYLYIPASDGDTDKLSLVDADRGDNGVWTAVGDDVDALAALTQAVKKFPNAIGLLQALEEEQGRTGDIAGQHGTAAKLAALIESQIHTPGHTVNALLNLQLAQAYWDSGNAGKGAATYLDVIRVYPHDPLVSEAYNGLAYAYAVTNDKAHLPDALIKANNALHLAQARTDITDEGKDEYIAAIQDTLGWVQYRLGDSKDALINIQQGVSANPRLAECRFHLAMVYKALGDTDNARMELGYALRLSQGYADAKRELAALPAAATSPAPASA